MDLSYRLRANFAAFWASPGERILRSADDWAAFSALAAESYGATLGQPEVERKAAFLERFAEGYPVTRDDGQALVGSRRFGWPHGAREYDFRGNHGHVIVDYGRVLRLGVGGLTAALEARQGDGGPVAQRDPVAQRNRAAMLRAVRAFGRYVERACPALASDPPTTFADALQLVWLVHLFLFAEGCASAFSFGRFDQYLGPFLDADLAAGRLTVGQAGELLTCFWFKCCEGCESQNLTLGGVDSEGHCAENALSFLALTITRKLRLHQPSVSVRLAPGTSPAFREAALGLCAAGFGMPSFLNDPVVIDGLTRLGIPLERARDYGIVGCYEATPQGDSAAFTVAGAWSLPEAWREFFDQPRPWPDFAALRAGWLAHLRASFPALLARFEQRRQQLAGQASPFASALLGGCVESGLTAEEGGSAWPLFGVNVLGFGTVLDSLRVVDELVYRERGLTLDELRAAVAADWPDAALRERCRQVPGRYGTGSLATAELAEELSATLGELLGSATLGDRTRLLPGLFWFGQDIMNESTPATPDGRRRGEPCSYGVGPSAAAEALSPTTVVAQAACVHHELFPCGTPLTLSFGADELDSPAGRAALASLLTVYFARGGLHLHVNAVDAAQLRAAQAEPERHADLLVRVSGFSAKFTALPRRWQDELIVRTERGV